MHPESKLKVDCSHGGWYIVNSRNEIVDTSKSLISSYFNNITYRNGTIFIAVGDDFEEPFEFSLQRNIEICG